MRVGSRAQSQRRKRRGRDHGAAGCGWQVRRARRRLLDEQLRVVADPAHVAPRSGTADAHRQHEQGGSRADRPQRCSDSRPLRLQLQPRGDAARSGARAPGPAARRPLYGRLRPGAHRLGTVCRRGAAGDELRENSRATPPFGGRPVQFVDVMPWTSDGKVHLCPPELDAEAPRGLYGYQDDPATERYPLALISPASERTVSSTLGELPRPDVVVEINPTDADVRHIEDRDEVRIFNDLGEVRVKARVTHLVRPGTISMPKGVWRRHTSNGWTSNALVSDSLTDLGAGACFNDARVEIAKGETATPW